VHQRLDAVSRLEANFDTDPPQGLRAIAIGLPAEGMVLDLKADGMSEAGENGSRT